MPPSRHHFEIEASFGPPELFKLLKKTAEDTRFRGANTDFEFDWMKRKVVLIANKQATVEDMLDAFIARVEKHGGQGLLLPGNTVKEDDRASIPIGVLLQTPDIYVEIIVRSMAEAGIAGIALEKNGNGFSVPITRLNKTLEYVEMTRTFPLPEYLSVIDCGIEDEKKGQH